MVVTPQSRPGESENPLLPTAVYRHETIGGQPPQNGLKLDLIAALRAELEDGWILGPGGELILWVPPVLRPCLYRPGNLLVIGDTPTRLDFTGFKHGKEWTSLKRQ